MNSSTKPVPGSEIPIGSWDCHVHVLDPVRYPFRADRTYTPSAATLDSLLKASKFKCILIVQASVENGPQPLLETLKEGQIRYQNWTLRGSVITSPKPGEDASAFDKTYADTLHAAGVRCLRIQGGYGSFGTDREQLQAYIVRLAQSYCVASLKWAISIQQPLEVWAGLKPFIFECNDLKTVNIIAEHNGSATPADPDSPSFEMLLDMLRDSRIFVKISALHRRSPDDIQEMRTVIESFAKAAPDRILWGTDWPHVNAAVKGLTPTAPLAGVDSDAELQAVKSWLSQEEWRKMLVENPTRVFA